MLQSKTQQPEQKKFFYLSYCVEWGMILESFTLFPEMSFREILVVVELKDRFTLIVFK